MDAKKQWWSLLAITVVFLVFYFLPEEGYTFGGPILEALLLARWYAREHVLTCLIPAFFIAGAIAVFVSKASVMRYLGAGAKPVLAYGVASVSGSILAVCSCTVLPLFAGIYRMGAGIGPATAFLYSGPAINVLAIILTARVLGIELGIARAIGAVVFAVVIGLMMHLIFLKEEKEKQAAQINMPTEEPARPLWQTAVYFALMVAILVFANWGDPKDASGGLYSFVFGYKWLITSIASIGLGIVLMLWFKMSWWKLALASVPVIGLALFFPNHPSLAFSAAVIGLAVVTILEPGEMNQWCLESWQLGKQIMPLLFLGVIAAGLLLGRPEGGEGYIPSEWVGSVLGGNSIWSNLFASIAGAFMYFATLTEVPIVEGLVKNDMGAGPSLALLLAGPALSLPNMLVIAKVMGWKKTAIFVSLVVVMATISGIVYGAIVG